MKHVLRLLFGAVALGFATTATAQTQITNSSLETWVTRNGHMSPQGWVTSEDGLYQLTQFPLAFNTVTRSGDRQQGTYAASLTPRTISLLGQSLPAPAALILGNRIKVDQTNPTNPANYGGQPYADRPANFSFWYKFAGVATDQTQVILALTRGNFNAGTATVIGGANLEFNGGSPTTYTQYQTPISYVSSAMPDTLRLIFITGANQQFSSSANFFVDNIALSGIVTSAASPALAAALAVYPNPSANGVFSLASLDKPSVATAPLSVTDVTGRVVFRQPGTALSQASGRPLDLHTLRAGLYTLRLDTPEGLVARKLIIQ